MRKKIIIGNWKMNLAVNEASLYLHKLTELIKAYRNVEVVVAPTMLALQSLSLQVNRRVLKLAAQNCYWRDHGPYTGEVSASQLRGIADFVIIGHSERRHLFMEREKDIRLKVQAALRNHLRPVLCIGETEHERALGEVDYVIADQLMSGLANVTSDEMERVIIAYEPVWAIGSGNNASPASVKAAVSLIRKHIAHLYGKKASQDVRVLYGGSVTTETAEAYLSLPGVDGLLIGAASLQAQHFSDIITKAHNM